MGSKEYHRLYSIEWHIQKRNKKRFCQQCNNEIDNVNKKIHKRTKFCSIDCYDDFQFTKKEKKEKMKIQGYKQTKSKLKKNLGKKYD